MLVEKATNSMKQLINELQELKTSVVIYGASDAGENYATVLRSYNVQIDCFIDDDINKQGKLFCGVEVISAEAYNRDRGCNENSIILIASYSPSIILEKIKEKYPNWMKRVKFSDFYLWEGGLDYFQYYYYNMSKIERVYELLSDEKSKRVFINLLNYKISRNHKLIEAIQDEVSEQYFCGSFINFTDREAFVDMGAYSGDTIKAFLKTTDNKYEKIIAIEPDESNFELLKENTKDFPNIDYYRVGIADHDGIAKFNAKALYTSHFDENGESEIETRSLDSIMNGSRVTFIKADIEGLENHMIHGAEQTIKTHKPKIAVAVYHKKDDIFDICLLLQSYRSDYKFYLRHYTEMPIDTVLYAI